MKILLAYERDTKNHPQDMEERSHILILKTALN